MSTPKPPNRNDITTNWRVDCTSNWPRLSNHAFHPRRERTTSRNESSSYRIAVGNTAQGLSRGTTTIAWTIARTTASALAKAALKKQSIQYERRAILLKCLNAQSRLRES
jgi:hypothetical protein